MGANNPKLIFTTLVNPGVSRKKWPIKQQKYRNVCDFYVVMYFFLEIKYSVRKLVFSFYTSCMVGTDCWTQKGSSLTTDVVPVLSLVVMSPTYPEN